MGPGAFRYVLALAVLVHHMSRLAIGETAVYVFFALSGYWITLMWDGKYSETANPYITYLISRLWRLLPVFWLCELLSFALEPWRAYRAANPLHFWGSQVAILGYNTLPFPPNVPAWSLDVELQFYVLAPILIWRMSWRLLLSIAAVSLGASLEVGCSFVTCSIFFALGIYTAKLQWRPSSVLMISCGTAILLILFGCLALPSLNSLILVGTHPGPLSKWNGAIQVAIGLLAIPIAIHTTGSKSGRIDEILADGSYTLYLLHWPLLQWANTHRIVGREIEFAAVFLACVLSSILLTIYFDMPIQRVRRQWIRDRKR